jgi:hypothetical protein
VNVDADTLAALVDAALPGEAGARVSRVFRNAMLPVSTP